MSKFKQLIFIDDDNPTNVYHKIVVEQSGLCEEAIFFEGAVEAFEYFKNLVKQDSYVLPDLIFLDINMPVMNGWDFIEAFNKLDIPSPLFIVLLTTSLSSMDKERAGQIGLIHKFLNKPLEVDKLVALQEECTIKS